MDTDNPWTKSETFAWNEGRRIVDLFELSKQLLCKRCEALLDLRRIEREDRFGFASVLYVPCVCGVTNELHTSRKQEPSSPSNPMYEVNIKASINLLLYGTGASNILGFLAVLDIPVPPPDDSCLIVPVTSDPGTSCTVTTSMSSSGASVASLSLPVSFDIQRQMPSAGVVSMDTIHSYHLEHSLHFLHQEADDKADEEEMKHSVKTDIVRKDGVKQQKGQPQEVTRGKGQPQEVIPKTAEGSDYEEFVNPMEWSSDSDVPEKADSDSSWKAEDEFEEKVLKKRAVRPRPVFTRKQRKSNPSVEPSEATTLKLRCEECSKDFPTLRGYNIHMKRVHSQESEARAGRTARIKKTVGLDPERAFPDFMQGEPTLAKHRNGSEKKPKTDLYFSSKGAEVTKRKSSSTPEHRLESSVQELNDCSDHSSDSEEKYEEKDADSEEENEDDIEEEDGGGEEGENEKSADCAMQQTKSAQSFTTEEEKRFRCEFCKKSFVKKKGLRRHKRLVHTARKGHSCSKCSFRTKSILELSKHERSQHPGEYSYHCQHCGKGYATQINLGDHISRVHERKYEKTCEICGLVLPGSSRLIEHLRTHTGERPYKCDKCWWSFAQHATFRRHLMDVHAEVRTTYTCSICQLQLLSKKSLNRHIRNHAGLDRFPCEYCGRILSSKSNLKTHVRLHTGEKPYTCQVCAASFAQKAALDGHIKKHQQNTSVENAHSCQSGE